MSLTNKEKKIVDSEREILWLKRQIEQYETESTPDKDDIHIPAVATSEHVEESVNIYRTHINSVRLQLDILSQFNLTKDELTKNIDYQHFTVESLYPKQSAFSDTDRIQWIQDKIKERDELVVEFMNILNDLNQKKLQLNNVQKSIIDQHIVNREIVTRINESKLSNQLLLAGEDDDLKELRKA
ncbi:hypothetical protein BDB01DRAFT_714207 [Pilobolus umbonatus]|nr:hypothetical protein BDB01DRAFT_714207 [Pilobolus umbonatus]